MGPRPAGRGAVAGDRLYTPAGRIGGSGVSSDVTVGVAQAMPGDAQIDPRETIAALRRGAGLGYGGAVIGHLPATGN
jgi:hypothetical protein